MGCEDHLNISEVVQKRCSPRLVANRFLEQPLKRPVPGSIYLFRTYDNYIYLATFNEHFMEFELKFAELDRITRKQRARLV